MIIYKFIKSFLQHRKYKKILKKVYKQENLLENLSQLYGTEFKMDWIGRIYTVINPNINNGQYDVNDQIFEYNENGFDNNIYVEKQIMKKLAIAQQYIQTNNLFDLLTYEIRKIDDYDNYLFIIQPITLEDYVNSLKKLLILLGVLTIAGIGLAIYF